jgi:membrane-bound hydrogenase subunit alpha
MAENNISYPIGPNHEINEPSDFSFVPRSKDEIRIPIGPQHPALKEPESFSVALRGERIMGIDVKIGYNHRGIEKACEQRSYVQDVYLIERICGICSHTHSTCFVQAVEELAGLAVPKRGLYIRTLIGELERIHSHLLWLGVAGHEIGFDTLLMYSWRDRELVMDVLADLTGNRVNYGMNTIGGVRRDLTPEQVANTLKVMDKLEEQTKYYIQLGTEETTLIQRLSGVGVLSHDDAVKLGAVGPTARASLVDRDVRRDDPYAAYADLTFKVVTDGHNDVYGRTLVRLGELMESYSMVRQLLKNLPDGPIAVRAPRKVPVGEALSRYEAPRGEDIHYVKANGSENPERVKVRAPTLANIQAVSKMLEDRYLADLPIVVAAIDPCFSCTDRAIAVDDRTSVKGTMNWEALRQYGIDWYKQQGVDFTKLKWGKK